MVKYLFSIKYLIFVSMALVSLLCLFPLEMQAQQCFTKDELVKINQKLLILEMCEKKCESQKSIIEKQDEQIKKCDEINKLEIEKSDKLKESLKTLNATIDFQSNIIKEQDKKIKWNWMAFGVGTGAGVATVIIGVLIYVFAVK